MEMINHIQNYFRGERDLAFLMIPCAIALAGLAYYSWSHYRGNMAAALTVVSIIMSLGLLCGGTIIMIKAEHDMAKKINHYQQSPQHFLLNEQTRIAKVNTLWSKLKILWAILIISSLALLLFSHNEWVKGGALALILGSSMFLVIDMLAEQRALIYQEQLHHKKPTNNHHI